MEDYARKKLIEDLEKEAQALHKSTRVDVPAFSPLHNYLRSRFPSYYRWSVTPQSRAIHVSAVIAFLLSVAYILASGIL